MSDDEEYEELVITPQLAAGLLAGAGQGWVWHSKLIRLLEAFDSLAGTVIYLDEGGSLVDGHHRCTLVALTGKSLAVKVVRCEYLLEWDLQVPERVVGTVADYSVRVMHFRAGDVRVGGVARDHHRAEQQPQGHDKPHERSVR